MYQICSVINLVFFTVHKHACRFIKYIMALVLSIFQYMSMPESLLNMIILYLILSDFQYISKCGDSQVLTGEQRARMLGHDDLANYIRTKARQQMEL